MFDFFPGFAGAPPGFPGFPPGFGQVPPSGSDPSALPPPIHPLGTANPDFPLAPREPAEDRRVRRALELLTSVHNALGKAGYLIQLPLGQWRLSAGVYQESRDPTAADDATRNVVVGDEWYNRETHVLYVCLDAGAGVAVWVRDAAVGLSGTFDNGSYP